MGLASGGGLQWNCGNEYFSHLAVNWFQWISILPKKQSLWKQSGLPVTQSTRERDNVVFLSYKMLFFQKCDSQKVINELMLIISWGLIKKPYSPFIKTLLKTLRERERGDPRIKSLQWCGGKSQEKHRKFQGPGIRKFKFIQHESCEVTSTGSSNWSLALSNIATLRWRTMLRQYQRARD